MKDHWYLATTPSIFLIISSPYGYNSWAGITLEHIDPPVIGSCSKLAACPNHQFTKETEEMWTTCMQLKSQKDTNPQLVGPNPIAFLLATHNVTEAVTLIELGDPLNSSDNRQLSSQSTVSYRCFDLFTYSLIVGERIHIIPQSNTSTSSIPVQRPRSVTRVSIAVRRKSLLLCSKSIIAATEFNILSHAFAESWSKSWTVSY